MEHKKYRVKVTLGSNTVGSVDAEDYSKALELYRDAKIVFEEVFFNDEQELATTKVMDK